MRKRIGYATALGLALAVAIPSTALADGTQRVEAGFLPQQNATVPIPPPVLNQGNKLTKNGTLYTRLFLENYGNNPSAAAVFDIHAPDELKFNIKGLARCNPDTIRGRSPDDARSLCSDAFLGLGGAKVFAAGQIINSGVSLFNGTKQNGFDTVLFHSEVGGGPVIVSEMQNSPLPGHGVLFHSLVAQGAGGPVPNATPIVDTDFTLSKRFTDRALRRKANRTKKRAKKAKRQSRKASGGKKKRLRKKAKRLNRRAKKQRRNSNKSWVQARCTDGVAVTRVEVTYLTGPAQSAETIQRCT